MQITDEADTIRLEDALQHDNVMVMVGDPETGRPLLTLSVTRDGNGLIEYEPGDLAAGIVQLNTALSKLARGEFPDSDIRVTP